MGTITLRQAAEWCGGQIDPKYVDVTFLGANNDSRRIQPGELFVALEGVRDGHIFIPEALEKGAAAVLCSRWDGTGRPLWSRSPAGPWGILPGRSGGASA